MTSQNLFKCVVFKPQILSLIIHYPMINNPLSYHYEYLMAPQYGQKLFVILQKWKLRKKNCSQRLHEKRMGQETNISIDSLSKQAPVEWLFNDHRVGSNRSYQCSCNTILNYTSKTHSQSVYYSDLRLLCLLSLLQ